MTTAITGYRDLRGKYHTMRPDCDRANAAIFAGRFPENLERGVVIDDAMIAARVNDYFTKGIPEPLRVTDEKIILSGDSDKSLWFLGWMFACAATGLATGTVVGVIINQLW